MCGVVAGLLCCLSLGSAGFRFDWARMALRVCRVYRAFRTSGFVRFVGLLQGFMGLRTV